MRLQMVWQALFVVVGSSTALADVTVTVDPTQDRHAISPLIYGLNFPAAEQIDQGGFTLARWGGNVATRYNYKIAVSNRAADNFFENIADCVDDSSCPPADPQESSHANAFLELAKQKKIVTLFSVPIMGYVAKEAEPRYGRPYDCGCPKSIAPNQQQFDPYEPDCGNGKIGENIWATCARPDATSISIGLSWNSEWVKYLNSKFGQSNHRRIYALDNEPNLWNTTHYDVHPEPTDYEELWQKMRDHAIEVLKADPTAEIAGPAEWGWPNYFCSRKDVVESGGCTEKSVDRAAHNGVDLTAWLLKKFSEHEKATGTRLLHWLDLHYYPQGGSGLEITRSLWDPSYTDPSWINENIKLIPRMHEWVANNYPGTKTMIGEYQWYQKGKMGAVMYADSLGIFGREGLDGATVWGPPKPDEVPFAGFKLYRNYDGRGGHFESTSVRATTVGVTNFNAYAAVGSDRLTIALINGNNAPMTANVKLAGGFQASNKTAAQWYVLGEKGSDIDRMADVAVNEGLAKVTLPATSIGMLVIMSVSADPGTDGGEPATDGGSKEDEGTASRLNNNSNETVIGRCGCASGGSATALFAALVCIILCRRRPR